MKKIIKKLKTKKKQNDLKYLEFYDNLSDLIPIGYNEIDLINYLDEYLIKDIYISVSKMHLDEDNADFYDDIILSEFQLVHLALSEQNIHHDHVINKIILEKNVRMARNDKEIEILQEELEKMENQIREYQKN
jgi:hypothetical protein